MLPGYWDPCLLPDGIPGLHMEAKANAGNSAEPMLRRLS